MNISKDWNQVEELLKAIKDIKNMKINGIDINELFNEMINEDEENEWNERINFIDAVETLQSTLSNTEDIRDRIHDTAQVEHVVFGNKGILHLENKDEFNETYGILSKLKKWKKAVNNISYKNKIKTVEKTLKDRGCK